MTTECHCLPALFADFSLWRDEVAWTFFSHIVGFHRLLVSLLLHIRGTRLRTSPFNNLDLSFHSFQLLRVCQFWCGVKRRRKKKPQVLHTAGHKFTFTVSFWMIASLKQNGNSVRSQNKRSWWKWTHIYINS